MKDFTKKGNKRYETKRLMMLTKQFKYLKKV